MTTRRRFLQSALGAGVFAAPLAALTDDALRVVDRARARLRHDDPEKIARDERYWRDIQSAFTIDRNWMNLNNGGVCPSPRAVSEAMRRYLDQSQAAPSYSMWEQLEPRKEVVRTRLAKHFGCDREEMAIVRNASEAMETLIFGIDLKKGDHVLACTHNYPRMLNTWRQRVRRHGIELETFDVPVVPKSPKQLVDAVAGRIRPNTRVIEVVHVANRNGQIWPVRDICRLGRSKGIEVFVDGAHAFAHFPFKRDELECDFYGTSLHKWLLAPHGTGFLYVRKDRIKDVWPLMAASASQDGDIRKYEEIGTHPVANALAIGEALTFHEGVGPSNKAARLRYLHSRWIKRLSRNGRVRLNTSDDPNQSCGLRLLDIDGITPTDVQEHLREKHGIITAAINGPKDVMGNRISPNIYTTLEEIDRFCDAVEGLLRA
ncbi:MAG: aminotransferase class V-fold PLP-dependent enzyme [Planctomycetes bacterium]|nr:aminotransferase class V-fold PLP-dependent enzyme [Planctomycetota bacterium]